MSAKSVARAFCGRPHPVEGLQVPRAPRLDPRVGSADRGRVRGCLAGSPVERWRRKPRWVRGSEAKAVISGEANRASSGRAEGATQRRVNGLAGGSKLRRGLSPRKGRSRLRRPRATGRQASAGRKGTHRWRGNSASARQKAAPRGPRREVSATRRLRPTGDSRWDAQAWRETDADKAVELALGTRGTNPKVASGSERSAAIPARGRLAGGQPRTGCGMKQGRGTRACANRREVEKT